MSSTSFYKQRIEEELARRCARNPRYSLRAFAKSIGVSHASLSLFLSGKMAPSPRTAQKLIKALGLSPDESQQFLASLAHTHRSRGLERLSPVFRKLKDEAPTRELTLDAFRVIADWYHYAILELTYVDGFKPDVKWIARELGIAQAEAKLAVERLFALELLEEKDGTWVKSQEKVTTHDRAVTNAAFRRHQKQVLERAVDSLENDPIEKRSMTSYTLAIDEEQVPLAKQLIEEFMHAFCQRMVAGRQTRVYQLGISFYPLQKEGERK